MPSLRRWKPLIVLVSIWLFFMVYLFEGNDSSAPTPSVPHNRPGSGHHEVTDAEDVFKNGPAINGGELDSTRWRKLPEHYPVTKPRPVPKAAPEKHSIPKIQAIPPIESPSAKKLRLKRQAAVKESFIHSWLGYKKYAWFADEVTPITGKSKTTFGGWAATLVDSLDSLWIMGLTEEFEEAVRAAETIDFSVTRQDRINVFESTIRYLGGFLGAYSLSGEKYGVLLSKATEVAELLMSAFDTENHMPIARWDWKFYMTGHKQEHARHVLVAELGSLSLEFTKLSVLTGDDRYYDAVQRIADFFEEQQDSTKLPGMYPIKVDMSNPARPNFTTDGTFTLGGMADSFYEYLPKQYLVLGGTLEQPRKMYEKFIQVAKKLFKRVSNPENKPLLVSGEIHVHEKTGEENYVPKGQHLTCFVGGMVGTAAKIFNRPDELDIAQQLTEGCVWAYTSCASGIMPEIFNFAPCGSIEDSQTGPKCAYNEEKWHSAVLEHYGYNGDALSTEGSTALDNLVRDKGLVPGFVEVPVKSYILRPEAIESVFIMYRLTGDSAWMDKAWTMFEAIEKLTRSDIGAWGLVDVTKKDGGGHIDTMESFWLAETLKYFYLVFSDFDVVDLDEWVLNTEAHPLRRPDVA